MEEWLKIITEIVILVVNGIALLVIVFGAIEALFRGLPIIFGSKSTVREFRLLYLGFGRYLVYGLTFQLAADIIETMNKSNWEDIGKLAAVAVIRTFLSYFLERDMVEVGGALPSGNAEISSSRVAAEVQSGSGGMRDVDK